MRQIEHFQNQYIRQTEVIDELRHSVKQHENALEKQARDFAFGNDHHYYEEHSGLKEEVEQFRKIYTELRKEFMRFHSRWM